MNRRILFFIWFGLIVFFSVVPHGSGDQSFLSKMALTRSGFFQHVLGYFVLSALAYRAFGKTEDRGQRSEDGKRQRSEGRSQKSEVTFIWMSGLVIFVCSLILEGVQYVIPTRTFNVYDVVGNGVGILSFVFIWVLFLSHLDEIEKKKAFHRAGRHTPQ